jgi:nitroreductase
MSRVDPILSRRSIRRFTPESVEEAQIRVLLTAGMCAPSADDERPWHFVVISDPAMRLTLSQVSAYTYVVKDAPVAILVCGDESLQKQHGCWMLDCAASTENILLEANLIGLGAVWLGIYPVEGRIQKVRLVTGAPSNVVPFSIVAVGHPAERKYPISRYDQSRVHYEQWDSGNSQTVPLYDDAKGSRS